VADDDLIARLRGELTEIDERLLEAVNARLELVAQLKRAKVERGLEFVDRAREEWLLDHLAATNRGPLSTEGLRELYTQLLALTKRELER
jgi:chorismate mutase